MTDFSTGNGLDEAHQRNLDLFRMDLEDIHNEFGEGVLTNTNMRRALRRIGDVMMVDQVKLRYGAEILDSSQFEALREYINEYTGKNNDHLFEWEDMEGNRQQPHGKPLLRGKHSAGVVIEKWRNIRFERTLKVSDYTIDTRVVRICGSHYPRSNRTRSSSFLEYSTSTQAGGGTHTVGQERSSWSISDDKRCFAEANFFLTVKLQGEKEEAQTFYLAFVSPFETKRDGVLCKLKTKANSVGMGRRGRRVYGKDLWLDVEDFVDLIGLIYSKGDEFVCWRDGCWDGRLLPDVVEDTDEGDSGEGGDRIDKEQTTRFDPATRYSSPLFPSTSSVSSSTGDINSSVRSWEEQLSHISDHVGLTSDAESSAHSKDNRRKKRQPRKRKRKAAAEKKKGALSLRHTRKRVNRRLADSDDDRLDEEQLMEFYGGVDYHEGLPIPPARVDPLAPDDLFE